MNLERLDELIDAWRDGVLTEAAASELSQLLRDCDEARRIFRAESQLHGLLHQAVTAAAVEEAAGRSLWLTEPVAADAVEKSRRPKAGITAKRRLLTGTGVLVLSIAAVLVWFLVVPRQEDPAKFFATLNRATDCVWEGPTAGQPGDRLAAGPLNLREGMAEVKLDNGVELLVEAPARLELVDAGNALLHTGRIVTRVPLTATGFVVDTPKARVVDLGTEFGVSVEPDRETIVQVFDGVVVAELKNSRLSDKRSQRLVAGETVRIDASGVVELQRVLFSHERFLRTFSTPSVHQGDELIPFKPSEISSLDVLPVPVRQASSLPPEDTSQAGSLRHGRVSVDGDLSDWNLSGLFEARCVEPFAESYFVHGCMMYDEHYLYVTARVGDPLPMRNLIDPNSDPCSAWMGGSVQLRLSTDRSFGWPLTAKKPNSRELRPQDISDRIVHLTLWYFQPREQPCLEIRYGMNMDRGLVNPPGWQGAFRKAPDGKSYTVECAIPWTLLGAGSDPPRAGDELGLSWTVNWSDASGKRWKGQLVEIKNPPYADRGKKALTFLDAETWGKAIYR
jgi:hypothetical protein